MGIADRLVLDGAQAEALGGVVGRLLEAAIVEHHHLRLPVFQEQFAVIGTLEPIAEDTGDTGLVEAGAIDQGGRGGGGGRCRRSHWGMSAVAWAAANIGPAQGMREGLFSLPVFGEGRGGFCSKARHL
jgi:hypothetical protein